MSLKSEYEKFLKSDKFKSYIKSSVANDSKFGGTGQGTEAMAKRCASEIVDYLDRYIALVPSDNFVLRMYGRYDAVTRFESGRGWVVEVRFDEDAAFSPSLRPDEYDDVYLPVLFNNGWNANGTVYGYWQTHDIYTRSRQRRDAALFIQRAVNDFNKKYAGTGIVAEYNPVYDGGYGEDYLDPLYDVDLW